MSGYQNVVTGIMLLICTLEDVDSRRISTGSIVLYSLLVLAGRPENIAVNAVPGICCLVISLLSHQELGYGDSLLILISGISLGLEQEIRLLMSAFLIAGIWSLIKLVMKKAERSSELPFLPFLMIGWFVSG